MHRRPRKKTKFEIKLLYNNETLYIPIDEITRFEGKVNYSMIFMANGNKYLSSTNLKKYEDLVSEYLFLRIHKQHIINSQYVTGFSITDGKHHVTLPCGSKFLVARRKVKEIKAFMNAKN
jgi:two-component system, LytTR family, response regulator